MKEINKKVLYALRLYLEKKYEKQKEKGVRVSGAPPPCCTPPHQTLENLLLKLWKKLFSVVITKHL